MTGVLRDQSTLAIAVLGSRQHISLVIGGRNHADQLLARLQVHATNTAGLTTHGTNIGLCKSNGLTSTGEQHDVVLAVGQSRPNQDIPLIQRAGNDAALHGTREGRQRRLFDGAHRRGHEDKMIVVEGLHRQHDVDLLVVL